MLFKALKTKSNSDRT